MGRKKLGLLVALVLIVSVAPLFSSVDIPADHPCIQYFGRWDFTNPLAPSPSHSWPGVYIYTEFEGTSIGVKMNDNYTYYNVFIDGISPWPIQHRSLIFPSSSNTTTAPWCISTGPNSEGSTCRATQ